MLIGYNLSTTKYDNDFKAIKENKKYLTDEQLSAEDEMYNKIHNKLKEEGSHDMKNALTAAMNLFYIVACDNGNMKSYGESLSNEKYVGLGMTYMTTILSQYALEGSIGYYTVLYIDAHVANPRKAMEAYMESMDIRKQSGKTYTRAELDAIELCEMYIGIFLKHNQNIGLVAESMAEFANSGTATGAVAGAISNNPDIYETSKNMYKEILEKFIVYVK